MHGGRAGLAALGVHAPPLDFSSTYPVPDLDAGIASIDALVAGGVPEGSAVYSRLYNPTVARVEAAIASLEGAAATMAFSSGMAAYTAALLVARTRGSHVVAIRPLYGSADHLLASGMLGLDVTFTTPDGVREACRPETSLVLVETPANPTLQLVDIADVVAQANGVPVMVDATFATPMLLQPLAHGATLVLHSATKALGGHGDVLAGVVSSNDEDWIIGLRQLRLLTGNVLHPMAAYLLHRGLATLALRVERSQANATIIAERLANHPLVAAVHYPGMGDTDPRRVLGRELMGPGSTLAFDLASPRDDVPRRLLGALTLITPAVSLGCTDTLIQHPASLTHRVVDPAVRDAHGIRPSLVRLSVGVEHVDDIWRDLERALTAAHAPAGAPATQASLLPNEGAVA